MNSSLNRMFKVIWSKAQGAWVAVSEIVRAHGKEQSLTRITRKFAVATVMSGGAAIAAPPAPNQLPTGGQIAAGVASMMTNGNTMTVTQSSNRASINWNTFDIGSQATVNFVQPSANAVALNRVNSPNPSQIFGNLNANGQVYLLNSAGVYFAPGAQVNVGGIVATTHSMSDAAFMAGSTTFNRNGSTGQVVNEGTIQTSLNGYIAMLAPEVRNAGLLVAQSGTIALAGGEAITLNFGPASKLESITVTDSQINVLVENRHAIKAPNGLVILSARAVNQLAATVINSGTIEAKGVSQQGGRIILEGSTVTNTGTLDVSSDTAQAGTITINGKTVSISGRVIATSPVQGGSVKVQATQTLNVNANIDASSAQRGGQVQIAGAQVAVADGTINTDGDTQGGEVQVVATNAQSTNPFSDPFNPPSLPLTAALTGFTSINSRSRRGQGGNATILGDSITLDGNTSINVSGATGGGNVLVGGDWQGSNGVYQATTVLMTQNVSIDASATESGNGGKVVLWSDIYNTNSLTQVNGTILAAGAGTGLGGNVETSGYLLGVSETAKVVTGTGGNWLLDPADVTIGTSDNSYTNLSSTYTPNSGVHTVTISNATLAAALNNGNVTVTTINSGTAGGYGGAITLANPLSWTGSGNLTLLANGIIYLNSNITASGNGAGFTAKANVAVYTGNGTSFQTNNGSIVLWSNANGVAAPSVHAAIQIGDNTTFNTSGSANQLTGGGSITMGGGTGTGVAPTGAASTGAGIGVALGYWGSSSTNVTMTTGGGNVSIIGCTSAAGYVGLAWTKNGSINAGSGSILLSGTSTNTGGSHGVEITAFGGLVNLTGGGGVNVTGTSAGTGNGYWGLFYRGNVTVNGTGDIYFAGNTPSGSTAGALGFYGNAFATSGNITFKGIGNFLQVQATVGQLAGSNVTSSSSNITYEADRFSGMSTIANSSGLLTIKSNSSSFSETFDLTNAWTLGSSLGGLTIGKTTENKAVLISNTVNIAGPINIVGSLVVAYANITTTGNGSGILFKSLGNVLVDANKKLQTNNGSITLWADSNGDGGFIGIREGVVLNSANGSTSQSTGGGAITLAGGNGTNASDGYAFAPSTEGAWGDHVPGGVQIGAWNPTATYTNDFRFYSGGGNILIQGKAATGAPGVAWYGGHTSSVTQLIDAGSGTITINGRGEGSGHGIEFGYYGANLTPTLRSSSNATTAISISGTATNGSASYAGFQGNVDAIANGTGGISLNGTSACGSYAALSSGRLYLHAASGDISVNGYGGAGLSIGGDFGKGNLLASSSNITFTSDKLSFSTSTINTTGNFSILSNGSAFATGLSLSNIVLNATVGGLTVGKITNTQDVAIPDAFNISGPMSFYGNNISVNGSLTTTGATGNILLKARSNIFQRADIRTNGSSIVYWSDSEADNYGGIYVYGSNSSSLRNISTNGGGIWMGGGNGTASWTPYVGATALTVGNSTASFNVGNDTALRLNYANISTGNGSVYVAATSNQTSGSSGTNYGIDIVSTTISTAAGDIQIAGNLKGKYTNGMALHIDAASTLQTSTGNITLTGNTSDITNSSSGWRTGLGIDGGLVKTVSGNISLTGNANTAYSATDSAALYFVGGSRVVSQTGSINIYGNNNASGYYDDGIRIQNNNITIGYDGTNAYSGDILIQSDRLSQRTSTAGTINVRTSGNLSILSNGSSFNRLWVEDSSPGSAMNFGSIWNFGTTLSSFTLGKTTNTYNIALANNLTTAGNISVYGGNITLSGSLRSTGANSKVLIKSLGTISSGADNLTFQTNNGSMVFWSNANSTSGGGISMTNANLTFNTANGSTSQATGGGDLIFGGGPAVDANGNPTGNVTSSSHAIAFNPGSSGNTITKMYTGGGNITLNAKSTGGYGVMFNRATLINAGNGSLNIQTNATGYGIEMNAYGGATSGTSITAQGITINGSSSGSAAVYVNNNFVNFNSTGSGDISITGVSAPAAGHYGVVFGGLSTDISNITSASGNITLNGTGNSTALAYYSGNIKSTAGGSISLIGNSPAWAGFYQPYTVNISTTTGNIAISANGSGAYHGVHLGGGNITATSGNISIVGRQNGTKQGVYIAGATNISTTAGGSLTLNGTAASDSGVNFAAVTTITTAGAGAANIYGTSTSSYGIYNSAALNVTTNGAGAVNMCGTSSSSYGIFTDAAVNVNSSLGAGAINVCATSSTSLAAYIHANFNLISSAGDITMSGVTNSTSNQGVYIYSGNITSTTGNISLTGRTNTGYSGFDYARDTNSSANSISSTTGNITITGSSNGSATGFGVDLYGSVASTTGNIVITGNGGSSYYGLYLYKNVTSTSGNITLTSRGSGTYGLLSDATNISSAGNISLFSEARLRVNSNIYSYGAGNALIIKSNSSIHNARTQTIQTNNGSLVLWANANGSTTAGRVQFDDEVITLNTANGSTSQTSGGGNIIIGGGTATDANGNPTGAVGANGDWAITFGGGTSGYGQLYSGGGNISIKGNTSSGNAILIGRTTTMNAGNGGINIVGCGTAAGIYLNVWNGAYNITAGGDITLSGTSSGSGTYDVDYAGIRSIFDSTTQGGTIRSTGGNVTLTGTGLQAGLYFNSNNNIISDVGNVTLTGTANSGNRAIVMYGNVLAGGSNINISTTNNNKIYLAGTVGQLAGSNITSTNANITISGSQLFDGQTAILNTQTGNITLRMNTASWAGLTIGTNGSIAVLPLSDSAGFGQDFYNSWFGINPTINGTSYTPTQFTIGNSFNTYSVYWNAARTVGGPVSLYGANVEVSANLITNNATTGNVGIYGNLSGAGNITVATGRAITVNQSGASTYSGCISGTTAQLIKAGAGTLNLTGNNTYSGATSINAGTLIIGGTGLLGGGSYAANIINAGNFTYNGSNAQTLSGVISGTGNLTQNGSGTLTLTGEDTYTGNTTINSGTLQIGNGSTSGSITTANLVNNGTLTFNRSDSISQAMNISGTGGLTKVGANTLTLTGTNTYSGATTISCGTLAVSGTLGASNSYSGNLAIASGTTFIWNGSAAETLSCITGAGTFNASGSSGTLTINGTQPFTGTYNFAQSVNVTGGTNAGTSGLGNAAAININDGGTVNLTGDNNSFIGSTTSTTSTLLTINSGGLLTSSNNGSFHLGRINLNGGTLAGNSAAQWGVYNLDQRINVTANSSISATNVTLGMTGGVVFNIGSGNTLNVTGTIVKATSATDTGIILSGGGTLLFSGANTYAGGTNVTAGTLQVGNGGTTGTLGVGNLAVNNATLAFNYSAGSYTVGNATSNAYITLNNATVNVAGGNVTLAGTSTTAGTSVSARKVAVDLLGTNNFTANGGASFNLLGNSTAAWTNSIVVEDGAVLNANGAITLTANGSTGTVGHWALGLFGNSTMNALSGSTLQVNVNQAVGDWGIAQYGTNATLSATGNATFNVSSLGLGWGGQSSSGNTAPRLNAANGTVTINLAGSPSNGGFYMNGAGVMNASATGNIIINGSSTANIALVAASSFTTGAGNLTINAPISLVANTLTLTGGSGNVTLGGIVSGTGAIIQNTTGVTTLSAVNTYSGTTTINSGALNISGSGSLGSGTYAGAIVNNGSLIYNSSAAQTLSGNISGTGTLTQNGSGNLTLTGTNNSFATNLVVNAGNLIIGGAGRLGNGSYAANITNNGALYFNSSANQTLSGIISGSGGLTLQGAGNLTLSGSNSYLGVTTLNAGSLLVSADGNLGGAPGSATPGSIVMNGGALRTTASFTLNANRGITLGSSNGTFTIDPSVTLNYAGVIAGTGNMTKSGSGTLVMSGSNSYSGSTNVTAGTLQIGAGGTLGSVNASSNINISTGTTLAFNRSDNITVANNISGAGALLKSAANTLTLTGLQTYTGSTNVTSGAIVFTNNATPTTSGFTGAGAVTIQPVGSAFTNAFSTTNYTYATTLTGLTIGNATSVANKDITVNGTAINISGPINLYGGNITLNTNLTTTAAGTGNITLAAAGTILTNTSSLAITTNGSSILFAADTDNSGAGAISLDRVSLTTSGGDITLGGGAIDGSGYAVGANIALLNGMTPNYRGVWLHSSSINAGGGNISIRGKGASPTAAGFFGIGVDIVSFAYMGGTGDVVQTSGNGSISIVGIGGANNDANSHPAGINIYSDSGVHRISTVNGSITFNGTAGTGTARTFGGIQVDGGIANITSTRGDVEFIGIANASGNGIVNAGTLNLGGDGTTNSSGNVTLTADVIGANGTYNLRNTGNVTIQSNGSSFGSAFDWNSRFALTGNKAGLTIGKTTNTQNVTVSTDTSVAGPINIYGGNIAINSGLTTSNTTTGNIGLVGNVSGAANLALASGRTLTVNQSGASTYSGCISGTTAQFIKAGAGALTLSGTNTYSGSTNITAGALIVTGSLSDSTVVNVSSGASYNVSSNDTIAAFAGCGTINLASAKFLTAFGDNSSTTFAGVIAGAGGLIKAGSGNLTLSNTNTYTGNTTISAGALLIGGSGTLGSGSYAGNISNNGSFIYTSSANQTLSGVMSGTGSLTHNASSTLTLSGANTFTGGANISAGKVIAGNSNPSSSFDDSLAVYVND
ncbi:autotransporter-associated beta strand repeat-containing protein, partial [Polynucleobacter sp. es-MAR-4]|uniref:autotransporter-associated beta strand repeat-containing protein n=1 Tax=Polynucleobacter sp. es-MAR-4 TaxID=1855655 RepID=UPI001C0E004C